MQTYDYFQQLKKPKWAPPAWVFGPVWTVLYIIIVISFSKIFNATFEGQMPILLALPFALNLIFNLSFTYFQFKLKNNLLASIDILLVLGTLVWAMVSVGFFSLKLSILGQPGTLWIAIVNIPYLLWVLFATALQLRITYLNR